MFHVKHVKRMNQIMYRGGSAMEELHGKENAMPEEARQAYSLAEVSKIVGVTPRSINNWIRKGQLKAEKVGNKWLIRPSDLEAHRKDKAATSKPQDESTTSSSGDTAAEESAPIGAPTEEPPKMPAELTILPKDMTAAAEKGPAEEEGHTATLSISNALWKRVEAIARAECVTPQEIVERAMEKALPQWIKEYHRRAMEGLDLETLDPAIDGYTLEAAAAAVGRTTRTLMSWLQTGKAVGEKPDGKHWRLSSEEVERLKTIM